MEIDEEIIKYQKGLIPKEVFFETLEREYRKRIVGFLLATSPSAEKVDDIYQEFILRVYQKIDKVSISRTNTLFSATLP